MCCKYPILTVHECFHSYHAAVQLYFYTNSRVLTALSQVIPWPPVSTAYSSPRRRAGAALDGCVPAVGALNGHMP